MRTPRVSELLIAAALFGAPSMVAVAEPATAIHSTTETRVAPSPASKTSTDVDRYAAREAKDTAVKEFRGGDAVIYIGGGVLTVAIIVILVLVLL